MGSRRRGGPLCHAPAAGSDPPCSLPGTWALCSGAQLWPLPVCAIPLAPPVSPATPGVTRGWPRALFTRLCLLGSERCQAGQRQDAVRLQHCRARDGEAHGPRGAAAGLPPAGQQVGLSPGCLRAGGGGHGEVWVRSPLSRSS